MVSIKSLLLGNGINIQFGGKAYTNRFIVQRIFFNIKAGKYAPLFEKSELSSSELLDVFHGLLTYANQVIEEKYDDNKFSDDMREAIKDFKNRYDTRMTQLYEIGLEDWFFLLEFFFTINSDISEINEASKQGIERIILDAIYNDGLLQNCFSVDNIGNRTKQKALKRFLCGYDNVFTLNYDNNVENLIGKPVYHLHGDYSVLADSENPNNIVVDFRRENGQLVRYPNEFKHCNCNALLDYSGKLKLKRADTIEQLQKVFDSDSISDIASLLAVLVRGNEEAKQLVEWHIKKPDLRVDTNYHFDKFRTLTGELHIIGMSPCNDSHIFKCIDNSDVEKVIFYYAGDRRISIIPTKKPYIIESVHDLWLSLSLNHPEYNCNYSMPKEPKLADFIELFNALTGDKYSKDEIIDEVNSTPKYKIDRLSGMVFEELNRQKNTSVSTESELINNFHEITRIALREGIIPPALLMMCVMNYRKKNDV